MQLLVACKLYYNITSLDTLARLQPELLEAVFKKIKTTLDNNDISDQEKISILAKK